MNFSCLINLKFNEILDRSKPFKELAKIKLKKNRA